MDKLRFIFNDGTVKESPVEHASGKLVIKKDSLPANLKSLEVMPDRFNAVAGDPGYYVIPNIENGAHHAFRTFFKERTDNEEVFPDNNLPVLGICRRDSAEMAHVIGMRFEFTTIVGCKGGKYYLFLRFDFEDGPAYEDIIVDYVTLTGRDACWQGMARYYRKYQLESGIFHTLREKCAKRPVLQELSEGIEVRVRLAWKPVPSPVEDQTPETEPEVHAELTLKDVAEIIEEFHRQGIGHAHFCLVGWNISGHDGRFPDIFPVEPKCGTLEELEEVIAKAKAYGYLITSHTNLIEGYSIAKRFNRDYTLKLPDGSIKRGGKWGGGKSYLLCPKMAYEKYAKEDLEQLRGLGFKGAHYFDVFSIWPPHACHDPEHPLTRKQGAEYRTKIMKLAQETMGASGSEGGFDFFGDAIDYCLYIAYFDVEKTPHPMCDEYIPLWPLVYHGILLYNCFAATVNASIKTDHALRVWNYVWGARPLSYVNSRFKLDFNAWGNEDLRFHPKEQFPGEIAKVKKDYDFYRSEFQKLQYEFMEDYESLENGAIRSTFSNGAKILGNTTDQAVEAWGTKLAPFEIRFEK